MDRRHAGGLSGTENWPVPLAQADRLDYTHRNCPPDIAMIHRLLCCLLVGIASLGQAADIAPQRLAQFQQVEPALFRYYLELFDRALKRSADPAYASGGVVTEEAMSPARMMAEVSAPNGRADAMVWQCHSEYLPPNVQVVPVPIDRGILSVRKLLVRRNDAYQFDRIQRYEDLASFRLSLGIPLPSKGWTGRLASLNLEPTPDPVVAINMLVAARVQAVLLMPRQIESLRKNGLIDDTVLQEYERLIVEVPSATCFYVGMGPQADQRRMALERGLRLLIQDGTALRLFKQYNMAIQAPKGKTLVLHAGSSPAFSAMARAFPGWVQYGLE